MTDTSPHAIQPIQKEESEDKFQNRMEKVQLFGIDLQRKADEQVALKEEIEKRWIDDLRHYNGKYDRDTDMKLSKNKNKGSSIFVNLTRAKTNIGESKLSDMILPTDDRNWGIKPTPVPDLINQVENSNPVVLNDGQNVKKEVPEGEEDKGELYTYADLARVEMEDAKKRCDNMQKEIDDQLTETAYNTISREVIHNSCVLGTGILKGPIIMNKVKKNWGRLGSSEQYKLYLQEVKRPTAASVDPWNFFPDASAVSWDDVEFVFERHMLTKKKVRDLLKHPGFMREQIKTLLSQSPRSKRTNLTYLNEIREINGVTQIREDNRYDVWEYHGPLKKEDLVACGCRGIDIEDPLQEFEGVVWFSGGLVIKVALNPMDDDSLPYSVFNWEGDETSVFGFGIPYRMRASQRVMNGSWRMLLDNAGLSTGPQIVLNRKVIEPADNSWDLVPRKIWYLKNEKYRVQDAFATFNIDSHQEELANIFQMAHTLAEEETNLPQLGAQIDNENQPAVMKTLGGTALWMSSQNVTMRRAVKNWDDFITLPFLTRMYYWNMQFNDKPELKGDYDVDARGTSVLLVQEMQQRRLMEFIQLAYSNPKWMDMLNDEGTLEETAKAMQIPIETIIKSKEQVLADEEAKKNEPPPPDPEMVKIEATIKVAEMRLQEKQIEAEASIQRELIQREVDLTKLAVSERKSLQDIQRDYNLKDIEVRWDRQKFYEEINIKRLEGNEANYGLDSK